MSGLTGAEQLLVVAGRAHAGFVEAQLGELGMSAAVLIEPEARDSGPAVAAACAWIVSRDPHGVAIIVASDHHVPDAEAFRAAALTAARAALDGRIVTMGVTPRTDSTAYGYIAPGDPIGEVREVSRFVEKPDAQTARAYVDAGYLWNSGNFVASAATLLNELDRHAPAIASTARQAVDAAAPHAGALVLGEAFRAAPKLSIDYAIMEKTARAAVLPVDFAWSDLGAWDAVRDASIKDSDGNAIYGAPVIVDAARTLVRASQGAQVAVVGVRNIAVVAEGDRVLVCDLSKSQAVKTAVERLRAAPVSAPFSDCRGAAHWFERWLRASVLALWWTLGADHARGGFHEALSQDGRPLALPRRARVQARQAFVYARAGSMGWSGPWRDAAWHGIRYLLDNYRRPDGLYRTLVDAHGAALDDTAKNYDQAFVLLAMAALRQADPAAASLESRASALLKAMQVRRHPAGGFREDGANPFQSNAHMHLFEAALAWVDAGGGREWRDLAHEIATLALTRFVDSEAGFVREFFDDEWRPGAGETGHRIEPGHQFEWAWLLHRWGRAGHAEATDAAKRLFACGLRGFDAERGVAVDALRDDFSVLEGSARLWPQTEFLKAALALGNDEHVFCAARALARYLRTTVTGLWRDTLTAAGDLVDEPSPASSLYHIIVAIEELRRERT